MPTTPGLLNPPNGWGTSTGSGGSTGYSTQYRGNYANLPAGITNAGYGSESAYTREVQPNELVSDQLTGLLDENGRYIQQARQSGLDTANDRGLLNSSIAAGNSTRAAIQAGLPIATADASAYGTAAGQNLDALNSILATRMNNATSRFGALTAASASRYNADLGLRNNRENRTYEGEQAGLNRSFQDYMTQQNFGNQMRGAAFQLGGQMLNNSLDFNHNLFLQAAQNPFMMNDPEALQGYLDFANQGQSGYYDDLFGYAMNGGATLPQWQENNQWYNTPDYSQEYNDGDYAGGGPQLPYGVQPDPYYGGSR